MPFATYGRRTGARRATIFALLMLAVVGVMDALITALSPPFLPLAALDEPAHLATASLVLLMLGSKNRWFAVATLVATVAIDLDHLPAALGSDVLTAGTPRPYTHSLFGIAAISLVALALFRRRDVLAGAALGLGVHLIRDLATGSGVALVWPISDHAFHIAYAVYFTVLVIAGLSGIGRAIANDRRIQGCGDDATSADVRAMTPAGVREAPTATHLG